MARSPSSTPTPRTVPLPIPSPPTHRSPLNPFGSSPHSVDGFLSTTPRKESPLTAPSGKASIPDDDGLMPLTMSVTDTDMIALPEMHEETMASTFRERSRSRASSRAGESDSHHLNHLAESKMMSSWWGPEKPSTRPWRQRTEPPKEHEIASEETRKRVARAVVSVLGTSADILHEALLIGADLLEFAPIPGLAIAAQTVVNIWDSVQNVDMNKMACLRLTERCADILLSVREDIHEAGDLVGKELAEPISKLEESYRGVYRFMLKQTNRPWLKRYLKRDEILRDIGGCDIMLRDALNLFGVSIQIRILRQVQENEKRREAETRAVMKAILEGSQAPLQSELRLVFQSEREFYSPEPSPISPLNVITESVTDFATSRNAFHLIEGEPITPANINHEEVIPALQTIHSAQNSLDASRDTSYLRQLLRAALATNSDKEILEVLQIGRAEMPDAIKALQREHERIVERHVDGLSSSSHSDIVTGVIKKRTNTKEMARNDGDGKVVVQRSQTIVSIDSVTSSSASGSGSGTRDTLDQEFVEMGIDCLTRMTGAQATVPNWTITKFEVDREDKIGVGFFSDVYRGSWHGRAVAIKVLAETTPRKLFLREVRIWKTLVHPNVLPLYGACSASGNPPWFLVSQYIENGNLVEYLKRTEQELHPPGLGVGSSALHSGHARYLARSQGGRSASLPGDPSSIFRVAHGSQQSLSPPGTTGVSAVDNEIPPRQWDLFRFMHEVAKGMDYLHTNGVLHGDLKAANVLVDRRHRCLISDFGQSEMKSEAFRISGTVPHLSTLRWQAPEFMSGRTVDLTPAIDVWAFAISCVEVLTMGRLPWPLMDDTAVRHFVLNDDTRPQLPQNSRFVTPRMVELLRYCWHKDPEKRYTFNKIARELKLMRKSYGHDIMESPRPSTDYLPELAPTPSPSPDMRPRELPADPEEMHPTDMVQPIDDESPFAALRQNTLEAELEPPSRRESTIPEDGFKMPEPVVFTPAPSRSASVRIPGTGGQNVNIPTILVPDGHYSPPPTDKAAAQRRNEGRYRMLLTHNHHPSLILPLWDPTVVELGAVGYLSKTDGRFVTFFNACDPSRSSHSKVQILPSIYGYGNVKKVEHRPPQRSVAQKAFDILKIGSLAFRTKSEDLIRRTSIPLKAGHPMAYLYTEGEVYSYFESLDAPKRWFQVHADTILAIYGPQANINKEDLFLIIGTLSTQKYGLMVSHQHPEGHAHFNVYSNPKPNGCWGKFTTDDEVPEELGPAYEVDDPDDRERAADSKVSQIGGPRNAVLLARLRFKPDALECTSR